MSSHHNMPSPTNDSDMITYIDYAGPSMNYPEDDTPVAASLFSYPVDVAW